MGLKRCQVKFCGVKETRGKRITQISALTTTLTICYILYVSGTREENNTIPLIPLYKTRLLRKIVPIREVSPNNANY